MPRGGKRPGAGRKPGVVTEAKRIAVERGQAALGYGLTPLEVMLDLMRTAATREEKLKAALGAAPYVHPRLAAVEMSTDPDKPMVMTVVSGVPRDEALETTQSTDGHAQARH